MNYKKIFRTPRVRATILKALSFVPDDVMLKLQYWIKTDRRLNLQNPQRFTEKLQWYKLYYRDPEMIRCVDKYDVRSYVEELGLGHILNECYGVYDTAEEVDFDKLPNQFVLKDTLGGGGNSVIIVKDKASADLEAIRTRMKQWVVKRRRVRGGGREWPYYNGKQHRIIVEKMLLDQDTQDLPDYKLFCFDGKVQCFYVREGYASNHDNGVMAFFDKNKNQLMGVGMDYCNVTRKTLRINESIDRMFEYAEILAARFPHVRVDFYDTKDGIVFGELTFFNASGYMKFEPDEFDFELGRNFELRKY